MRQSSISPDSKRQALVRIPSHRFRCRWVGVIVAAVLLGGVGEATASSGAGAESALTSMAFLWIAVILVAAKLSSLVERLGQPAVLGELVVGVLIGNAGLLGFHYFESIQTNPFIVFLAELGVVILLFQVGLESNIQKMRAVGWRAFLVASVGVVVPFLLGTYVVGPWLLPGLSFQAHLFLGATLTATSVGITARVFKDLNKLQLPEAQIVLGAAVIDDVLGLIILAVVSASVTVGSVGLGVISGIAAKAILFLIGAIVVGQLLAPRLGRLLAGIHAGVGMKLTLAIAFGLTFAYLAERLGLAPIVGAFAAGLVLDPVHFRYFKDPRVVRDVKAAAERLAPEARAALNKVIEPHADRHVDELVAPIGHFLVPIFFVATGLAVKLDTLANPAILGVALAITVAAFIGKIVAGAVAGRVNKWVVGVGMIPRGEVGLIFAVIGKNLGVVSDQLFSALVIMVIISTLFTPPVLGWLLRRGAATGAVAGASS